MGKLILAIVCGVTSSMVFAGGANGIWKTEVGSDGGYLEITIAPCASNSSNTCGKISSAYTKKGKDPSYTNLGKLMVKDMKSGDGLEFSGGTIWDPQKDKTYKSKMTLKGDDLDVEGCVSIFCSGQDWKRVK